MLNVIQGNNLKELFDRASLLKTPYIAFTDDHIYGFTTELGYMRRIETLDPSLKIPGNIISSDILKTPILSLEYDSDDYSDSGYIVTTTEGEKVYIPSIRPPILYGVLWPEFCKRALPIIQPDLVYYKNKIIIDDIKPMLDGCMDGIKSSDGALPLNIDGRILYIYKGLIPYNKPDKVSCTIYDQGERFITDFRITKKKNIAINVAIMYQSI